MWGASGALPRMSLRRLVRSAEANAGWWISSWAMAGTTKAMSGRSRSTIPSHRPASKVGRWSTVIPDFIGLWMNPSPAKVKTGDAVSHPVPCHSGSWLGILATWPCRTATPLGRPVVPDVYMMSARSSPSSGAWIGESSSASHVLEVDGAVDRRGAHRGHQRTARGRSRRAVRGSAPKEPLATTAVTSACSRMPRTSGGDRRLLSGTATAPSLWTAL